MHISGYISGVRAERPRRVKHHKIQDEIAELLQAARDRDGRSPAKLGEDAKVGRKSVERLLAGKNSTLTTLGAVADQLGLTVMLVQVVRKRTPMLSGDVAQHKESRSAGRKAKDNPDSFR